MRYLLVLSILLAGCSSQTLSNNEIISETLTCHDSKMNAHVVYSYDIDGIPWPIQVVCVPSEDK